MTAYRAALADRKLSVHQGRQFITNVVIHAVMRGPGLFRGVEIEPGAFTQIVSGIVGHVIATRAGVWHDQRYAQFGGNTLGTRFGGEVFVVAGQA